MPDTLAQYQAAANPQDWDLAKLYADQFGIPQNIMLAVVAQESSWNPNAQSPNSSSVGYGQLTAGTAKDLGVNPNNPSENLFGTAKYLSEMYTKFGNWTDALAHYNQGPNQTDPSKLAQGAKYAQSVESIANTGPASGSTSDSTVGGTMDKIMNWVKSQLGNFFFLLVGLALIVIALLHNDTVRGAAKDAAAAAVV